MPFKSFDQHPDYGQMAEAFSAWLEDRTSELPCSEVFSGRYGDGFWARIEMRCDGDAAAACARIGLDPDIPETIIGKMNDYSKSVLIGFASDYENRAGISEILDDLELINPRDGNAMKKISACESAIRDRMTDPENALLDEGLQDAANENCAWIEVECEYSPENDHEFAISATLQIRSDLGMELEESIEFARMEDFAPGSAQAFEKMLEKFDRNEFTAKRDRHSAKLSM